jgi:hypothetical protein
MMYRSVEEVGEEMWWNEFWKKKRAKKVVRSLFTSSLVPQAASNVTGDTALCHLAKRAVNAGWHFDVSPRNL